MPTFDDWQNGTITDEQALRSLSSDLGEVESQLAPIEAEKHILRDQISQVLERAGGATTIAGFGRLEITAPAVVVSYDKKQIEELLIDLTTTHPDIAARLAACRVKGTRSGSLRITREKHRP
jgi:hypothetical protein